MTACFLITFDLWLTWTLVPISFKSFFHWQVCACSPALFFFFLFLLPSMGVCEIIMLNICTGEKILEVENMFCVVNEHLQA